MDTVNKQSLLIYNPFSGQKRHHKTFPMIINRLSEMGYQLTITEWKDQKNPIKKACQNKWDAVFIAGGDGTVNYALQYLAREENRPTIGLFPFGTSNEFAKYIGISTNMAKALSVIEKGVTKTIDVGKFGDQYFANIASAGWLSDITYNTSPFFKSYLGEWAYALHFLKTFIMTKPSGSITIKLSPDDEVISELSLFLIMNGNAVGPFERLIQRSTSSDGSFHLLTCKKTNRLQLFLTLMAKLFNMKENSPIIQHTTIHQGHFSIPNSLLLNLDGEKFPVKNLQFEVLPQRLQVFSSDKM